MADLLPYSISYENSRVKSVQFDNLPVVALSGTIFDGMWKLTRSRRPLGEGCSLLTRCRSDAERTLILDIAAASAAELSTILCTMRDVFDYDLEHRTPGRLWVNKSYLNCWCSGRAKELSCDIVNRARVKLTIIPAHPAWCEDRIYSLKPDFSVPNGTVRYLSVYNSSGSPAPLRITLNGPSSDPSVKVNGVSIGIVGSLADGESLIIDQQSRTLTRYTIDGQTVNCFDRRIKNGKTFEYVPSGQSEISTAVRTMGINVTLIEQRSEPSWCQD